MNFSHFAMVLNAVLYFPGLDRKGLAQKIEEMYGEENWHVKCMMLDDIGEHSRLSWLLGEIYCVKKLNGHFYYDEELSPKKGYQNHKIIKIFLEEFLMIKSKKEVEEHGENIKPTN